MVSQTFSHITDQQQIFHGFTKIIEKYEHTHLSMFIENSKPMVTCQSPTIKIVCNVHQIWDNVEACLFVLDFSVTFDTSESFSPLQDT